jgi:predicted acetyltransferase
MRGVKTLPQVELRPLRREDEASFVEAVEAFRASDPGWEFALARDRCGSFADYVEKTQLWSQGKELPDGFVPGDFLVAVVDGVVVGRVSIRHQLNDYLRQFGGHIGYGVVPNQRRQGYATAMLQGALPRCAELGIKEALILCNHDNIGSRRVIELCGGRFEGIVQLPEEQLLLRRYWVPTG